MDGTDFRIQEPTPFHRRWYSHKFHGPAVRYEVAINIQNGYICHVNGPFPAGAWPDQAIAWDRLCWLLANSDFPDEKALADGGYNGAPQFFETPNGLNNEDQRMKQCARARHETVNRQFKRWKILSERYHNSLERHGLVFMAIANITQLFIEVNGHDEEGNEAIFQVEYNDRYD